MDKIKTLMEYLKENHISYAKFGKLIMRSKAQVGIYARGISIPKKDIIQKIEKATSGEVNFKSFYL